MIDPNEDVAKTIVDNQPNIVVETTDNSHCGDHKVTYSGTTSLNAVSDTYTFDAYICAPNQPLDPAKEELPFY